VCLFARVEKERVNIFSLCVNCLHFADFSVFIIISFHNERFHLDLLQIDNGMKEWKNMETKKSCVHAKTEKRFQFSFFTLRCLSFVKFKSSAVFELIPF
jgi:hypothetical protein